MIKPFKTFRQYITESTIDPYQLTLNGYIFLLDGVKEPCLKPEVIETIQKGIEKLKKKTRVIKYNLIGSIITRQYNNDSDIDVNILVSCAEKNYKKLIKYAVKISGQCLPGSSHEINYHLLRDEKQFKLANMLSDALYDIDKNRYVRKPVEKPFRIEDYWAGLQRITKYLNHEKAELQIDSLSWLYLKQLHEINRSNLKKYIEIKLHDLEKDSEDLINIYEKIKEDRRKAFDHMLTSKEIREYGSKNRLPANVIYKLLEKMSMIRFLHTIEKITGKNRELSEPKADELAIYAVSKS